MTVATLCDQRHVEASEPVQCIECKGWIAKGETYEETTGRWLTGIVQVFGTCQACQQARLLLLQSLTAIPTDPEALQFGTLKYDLEHVQGELKGEEHIACMAALAGMQARREAALSPSRLTVVR